MKEHGNLLICSTEMTGACLSQMDMLTKIGKCKILQKKVNVKEKR